VALDETRPAFPVNLGSAWFGQNKLDRAIAEFRRALELDPEALNPNSGTGVTAQVSSPEQRARYDFMLAKIYAQRGRRRALPALPEDGEGGRLPRPRQCLQAGGNLPGATGRKIVGNCVAARS